MTKLRTPEPRSLLRRALATCLLLAGASCAPVDAEAVVSIQCPTDDPVAMEPVSKVLERRCGTLDCHGSTFRPLRIFGQGGLRRPESPESFSQISDAGKYEDYNSGLTIPTTDAEIRDNARSVCGLEPEKTAQVIDGEDPGILTFMRKPRLTEKHKGGRLWNQGDPGDLCMVKWLQGVPDGGTLDTSDCAIESNHP